MATLKKSEIARPVLKKQAVAIAELGGEVVVRGLMLSERLALFAGMAEGKAYAHMAQLLALCVQDCDGVPVFTADEWDIWAADHAAAAVNLFDVARRVSGLDAEIAAKN